MYCFVRNRTYIGAFERGERNLSLQNLLKIANALSLPLSSLLAEAEAPGSAPNVTVQGGIKKTSNMKSHVISTKTSLDWIYTG